MTTFTVQVKEDDVETVLAVLKKFKAKVVETSKPSKLTLEIVEAIKETRKMREGKIPPLTLKDI